MADTGWLLVETGTSEANGTGATSWTNPDNVDTDDATYATNSVSYSKATHFLRGVLGTNAPDTTGWSSVDGVETRHQVYSSEVDDLQDDEVLLVVNLSATGTDGSTADKYATTATDEDRGGAADLWGTGGIAVADIDADFGFQFSVDNTDVMGNRTCYCDAMWVKIHYSTGGGGGDALPMAMHQYRLRR